MKHSNIPPTFFLDFFSLEEENTLILNDLEEFVFYSVICIFSWHKFAKIVEYFELTVPRYHCDGLRSHFWMTSTRIELLTNWLAPTEHIMW